MQNKFIILFIILLISSTSAYADRKSYSYFGAGYEYTHYSETGNILASNSPQSFNFESNYTGGGVNLEVGSYIPLNKDWGFYIAGGTAAISSIRHEDWTVNGIPSQTNAMTIANNFQNVIGSFQITPDQGVLFGIGYRQIEFTRFDFEATSSLVTVPTSTITESAFSFNLVTGYEWSNYFKNSFKGWRHRFSIQAELPLYTSVSNTNLSAEDKFTDSLNGYGLVTTLGMGYQINKKIMVGVNLRAGYFYRNGITRNKSDGSAQALPDNAFYSILPSFIAYWAY